MAISVPVVVRGQRGVPAVGQLTGDPPVELAREIGVVIAVARDTVLPVVDEGVALRGHALEDLADVVRDVEVPVGIPAVGLLGEVDLVLAERAAVGLLRVLAVRAAVPDMGAHRDQAWALVVLGRLDGGGDRGEVVAVLDPLGVPAVGVEALRDVLRPRHRRRPVELDAVVVVEVDELAEPEVAGERRRFGRDALLQVAVGDDPVHAVVDQRMVGAVELGREAAFGDRHADPVGEALAERAGGRLDAGRQAVLGMAGRARAPLAEGLQVLQGDPVAGQVEERVQEHAGVPGGQDEPVAVRPVGMRRGVPQEPRPHDVRHRRGAHGSTRVTGVRLLDTVDRQGPDRVDGEAVEVGGDGH